MVPDFVFIVALNTNTGNKMLPDFIHVHVPFVLYMHNIQRNEHWTSNQNIIEI